MMDKLKLLYHKHREVLLYLIFGGLTTVVNYGVYLLCARLLPVDATTVPTAIAWVLSVLFAYATNRAWVFRSKTRGAAVVREMAAFFGARVFSGLLDVAIMWAAVDRMGYNDLVVKLLSNVLVILINYFLSKFLIFRKKPAGET